jgi:hypothetical protein
VTRTARARRSGRPHRTARPPDRGRIARPQGAPAPLPALHDPTARPRPHRTARRAEAVGPRAMRSDRTCGPRGPPLRPISTDGGRAAPLGRLHSGTPFGRFIGGLPFSLSRSRIRAASRGRFRSERRGGPQGPAQRALRTQCCERCERCLEYCERCLVGAGRRQRAASSSPALPRRWGGAALRRQPCLRGIAGALRVGGPVGAAAGGALSLTHCSE